MKAVMSNVPPEILAWRKTTGADRWDEMWEGVLHLAPAPNRVHQDLSFALEAYLRNHWARPNGCKAYREINVAPPGGWPHSYRIPDLVLLSPDRFAIDKNEYFEGAPLVVVEIRSPHDETYEKLPFYASLGIPEVWVIERDSKKPEIHLLDGNGYRLQLEDPEGWLHSPATGIEMRASSAEKLQLRPVDAELPED